MLQGIIRQVLYYILKFIIRLITFVYLLFFLILENGTLLHTKCVVLTTGTFLNGEMFRGLSVKSGGRINAKASIALANTIKRLGFKTGRMKTGTPPRLEKNSINYTNLDYEAGDKIPIPFSFMNDSVWLKVNLILLFYLITYITFLLKYFIQPEDQLRTYITITNNEVHQIVLDNLNVNKHVKEEVKAPRYCPSIESKALKYVLCISYDKI